MRTLCIVQKAKLTCFCPGYGGEFKLDDERLLFFTFFCALALKKNPLTFGVNGLIRYGPRLKNLKGRDQNREYQNAGTQKNSQ